MTQTGRRKQYYPGGIYIYNPGDGFVVAKGSGYCRLCLCSNGAWMESTAKYSPSLKAAEEFAVQMGVISKDDTQYEPTPPCPPPGLGKLAWTIRQSALPAMRAMPEPKWGDWNWPVIASNLEAALDELLPKNTLLDAIIVRSTFKRIMDHWPPHAIHPHYPDIIAAESGWKPLEPGEKMEVGYGGARYEIRRLP